MPPRDLGNHDLHLLAVAYGRRALGATTIPWAPCWRPPIARTSRLARQPPLMHEVSALERVHGACRIGAAMDMHWRENAPRTGKGFERDPSSCSIACYGDQPESWTMLWKVMSGCAHRERLTRCAIWMRRPLAARQGSPRKRRASRSFPWFEAREGRWRGSRIVFGHWSTLDSSATPTSQAWTRDASGETA